MALSKINFLFSTSPSLLPFDPSSRPTRLSAHLCLRFKVPYSAHLSASPSPRPYFQGAGFKTFFDSLSSTVHRDTIATPLVEAVAKPLRDSLRTFPYDVPQSHRPFLSKAGINISDFGTKSHPHPIHKTIETNLLSNVWKHYASEPSSVLFMKPSKFVKMTDSNPNFTELCNFRLVPKDVTRYPETSASLPTNPVVFMHDALMYFSPSQILGFFVSCPSLHTLYASLVVPPESEFTSESLDPNFYRFSKSADKLRYILENNPAHSYEQPISALDWLKTSMIVGSGLQLTVSILDSWGPVHSLVIQRGAAPLTSPTDTVSFKVPEAVLLPSPNSLSQSIRDRLVPRSVYNSLFAYTRAVRTLRVTDPAGFVRTQSNKPEFNWVTSAAWDNLQAFSVQTAPHRPISHYMLFRSPFQRFKHWCKTNEFYFFVASSLSALPPTFFCSRALAHLFTSQILSCSIFWRWIVSPPTTLATIFRPTKPSFFSLSLEPRQRDLFSCRLLREPLRFLHSNSPAFLSKLLARFQPARVPTWGWCLVIGSTCIPLAFLLHRWFAGPDTPQSLHDAYVAYFHSSNWELKFERAPRYVQAEPFLPQFPLPSTKDDTFLPDPSCSDHITIISADVPHLPFISPPAPSVNPEPEPCDLPQPPTSDLKPASSDKAPPSSSSPTSSPTPPQAPEIPHLIPDIPSTPGPELVPEPSLIPSDPSPIVVPLKPRSAEDIALSLRPQTPPPSKPAIPENALAPATSELILPSSEPLPLLEPASVVPAPSSNQPSVSVSHTGSILGVNVPVPPTVSASRSSLLDDSSCSGEVTLFSSLFPAPYRSSSGDFQTRLRSAPPSDTPYPSGMDCLLVSISSATHIPTSALWETLRTYLPDSLLNPSEISKHGLSTDHLAVLSLVHSLQVDILSGEERIPMGVSNGNFVFSIRHTPGSPGHFSFVPLSDRSVFSGALSSDIKNSICSFTFQGQVLPFKTVHTYCSNVRRAKNLISNMKNGFDGVMANVDPLHPSSARDSFLSLDAQLDIAVPRCVQLVHLAGFAGCGKSYPVQQFLKSHSSSIQYKVSVPTTELRAEWKQALNLTSSSDSWKVSTWEASLLKRARVLVIDEVYKMPPGYLDLSIHSDPTIQFVILLGDPLQGEYHSSHPSSSSHRLSSEIRHLSPYIDFYCLWSRRIPRNVAQFFGVPSLSDISGENRKILTFPPDFPLLVNSQAVAKTMEQAGYKALTISSSQGATFSAPACVLLDKNSRLLSPQNSLVALTRSRRGVLWIGDFSLLSGASGNILFSKFTAGLPIDLLSQFPVLKSFTLLNSPLSSRRHLLRGASSSAQPRSHVSVRDPVVPGVLSRFASAPGPSFQGDVFLDNNQIVTGSGDLNSPQVSTFWLPTSRRPLHFDLPSAAVSSCQPSEADFAPPVFEPFYPGEDFLTLAAHSLEAHDPELKEIWHRGEKSNQFPFIDRPFHISCQPSSLVAAIHNERHDPTLLVASLSKRLRFRASSSSYVISPSDEVLGTLLFSALCRAYRRDPNLFVPFDENLFVECISANEFSQLTSKTQSTIIANANRSDPDWRWTAVRIFTKTQHKVNDNSIFGDWKACQTLALMHDAVILLLGPVKKYQRIFDSRDRPDNIYVHAGNTPSDMAKWCQRNLSSSEHVANDYTAFDQSQHGEAVVLERKKMERLCIPQHLIDLHVFLKTNVTTQFGPLTCMRLTGEPGTYDDNTDYNLAVLHLEYSVGDTGVMVSGDDSLLDSEPPTRFDWPGISPLLSLRFKKEKGLYSQFCGYFVGSSGACRSPRALFFKLMIALDDGSISDKIASFAAEFAIGHCLGEDFWSLLPLELVPYQSAVFDFFCRFAPKSVKSAFQIGLPPSSVVDQLFPNLSWVSNVSMSMLSGFQRIAVLNFLRRRPRSLFFPDALKGELLPGSNFNSSEPSVSDHYLSHQTRIKFSGGSSPLMSSDLRSLLTSLLASLDSDAPVPAPMDSTVLPGHSSGSRLVGPPQVPVPSRSLTTPSSLKAEVAHLPFQVSIFDFKGDSDASTYFDPSSRDSIISVIKPFSYARLTSLEAVVFPSAPSLVNPISFDAVWTTADSTIAGDDIVATYGSQRVTFGGPVSSSLPIILPADLKVLNPVLRDSVTYKDTPRLCLRWFKNPDAEKTKLVHGSLIIRGVFAVSGPRPVPTK